VVCTVVEMKVLLDFKTTTTTTQLLQVVLRLVQNLRPPMTTYSNSIVSLVRAGTCPRNPPLVSLGVLQLYQNFPHFSNS
jgi:hypothetical protein